MREEPRSKSTAHKTGQTPSKRNAKGHLTAENSKKKAVRWALGNEVLCQMRSLFPPLTSQFSQLDRRTTKIFEELPQSVLRRKRKVKVYTYITLLIKLDHLENSTSLKIPLLFE